MSLNEEEEWQQSSTPGYQPNTQSAVAGALSCVSHSAHVHGSETLKMKDKTECRGRCAGLSELCVCVSG